MGRTRPAILGWASTVGFSTVHMQREQWRRRRRRRRRRWRRRGKKADLWWLTVLLAAVEVPAITVLTISSPVFFCFFVSSSVFPFFSLGSLLFIPILLLSSFSLSLSFFLALPSPVFIGKKQGRERMGRPLCCRPSTAPPTRGKLWVVSTSF